MRRNERGFLLLGTYYILSMVILAITIGLTRTMTEVSAANRFIANTQAFHLADGGLDAALLSPKLLGPMAAAQVTGLLRGPDNTAWTPDDGRWPNDLNGGDPNSSGTYGVIISDNQDEPVGVSNDPMTDTDRRVILTMTGTTPTGTTPGKAAVRASIQIDPLPPGPFNYGISTSEFVMRDSAKLGRVGGSDGMALYLSGIYSLGGTPCPNCSQYYEFQHDPGNQINAGSLDFVNPWNLPLTDPNPTTYQLCEDCNNPTIFPGSPTHNTAIAKLGTIAVQFGPYYQKAIDQCVAEGNGHTIATCQSGAAGSVHHITTDTTIYNKNGVTVEGVIYVETGVKLTLKGNVTINGMIVHEGSGTRWEATGLTWKYGFIELANKAHLTIDSFAKTDVDGNGVKEAPMAPGLAVMGGAILKWGGPVFGAGDAPAYTATLGQGDHTVPGIKGFVMAGVYYDDWNAPNAGIALNDIGADGVIDGGVIGVWSEAKGDDPATPEQGDFLWYDALRYGTLGPETETVYYYIDNVFLSQNAEVWFHAPPGMPPGFGQTPNPAPPHVECWEAL